MFGKKPKEGTEDQAHDLMNLGGFGGLKRKPQEAPPPQACASAAQPAVSQIQKQYEPHEQFDEQAKGLALYFKKLAEFVVENSRDAANGKTGVSLETVFKHVCYRELIRIHLETCLYLQYPLMESVLYHCQKLNRPDLHLVELVTLAHWRPLLSLAYQELFVPILNDDIKSVLKQKDVLASFQGKHRFAYGTVDHDQVKKMTDEEIMVNFLKTIPVYQAPFLTMPFTLESSELSPVITHGKDFFNYMPDYRKTWVTTSLKFAYDTIRDMKKLGRGVGLDQFPNQGPSFALLMLFFFHQINMDVDPVRHTRTQRYPAETIPDVEPVKENMMSANAGGHIFENLVPAVQM
ncbi:TPA: hypothetical protein QDB51_003421 [Burkholderia vietnamiensis]|nr:hypothetical protein [Burkholderia vietnamiensis]